jgi:hypothetical protein
MAKSDTSINKNTSLWLPVNWLMDIIKYVYLCIRIYILINMVTRNEISFLTELIYKLA